MDGIPGGMKRVTEAVEEAKDALSDLSVFEPIIKTISGLYDELS